MRPYGPVFALLVAACIVAVAFGGCILDNDDRNRPPVIESLSADRTTVYPDSVVTITVRATDRDDDRLRYDWCATCGSFLLCSSGPTMLWVAPASAGVCTVSVAVSDEADAVSESLEISVVDLPRPVIVMDRCPCPRCPDLLFIFHGEFEDRELHEFYYSWTLSAEEGAPCTHLWTEWQPGVVEVSYPDPPCGLTYTFRVRCALPWGAGLLECDGFGKCEIEFYCR